MWDQGQADTHSPGLDSPETHDAGGNHGRTELPNGPYGAAGAPGRKEVEVVEGMRGEGGGGVKAVPPAGPDDSRVELRTGLGGWVVGELLFCPPPTLARSTECGSAADGMANDIGIYGCVTAGAGFGCFWPGTFPRFRPTRARSRASDQLWRATLATSGIASRSAGSLRR